MVRPDDSPHVVRGKIGESKFVQPHKNFVKNVPDVNPKIEHEIKRSSKNDMEYIISFMKQGHDRRKACEKAGIDYKLFLEWYTDGLKNCNKKTRNFWRQVKKIEQENKHDVRFIQYNGHRNEKDKAKSNKDSNNPTPVTSVPNLQPYSIDVSEDTKDYSNCKPDNFPENMEKFISFMKQGNSRSKAARKADISIEQVLRWYGQGSKDFSPETTYFYNQMFELEQKNEKPSKYNFIPKNKRNN